jgi:hypothetical protein
MSAATAWQGSTERLTAALLTIALSTHSKLAFLQGR